MTGKPLHTNPQLHRKQADVLRILTLKAISIHSAPDKQTLAERDKASCGSPQMRGAERCKKWRSDSTEKEKKDANMKQESTVVEKQSNKSTLQHAHITAFLPGKKCKDAK